MGLIALHLLICEIGHRLTIAKKNVAAERLKKAYGASTS